VQYTYTSTSSARPQAPAHAPVPAATPASPSRPAPDPTTATALQLVQAEQNARIAAAQLSETQATLTADRKAIGEEKANVFGVQLGQPLALPVCAASPFDTANMQSFESGSKNALPSVPTTCRQTTGLATQTLALRIANVEGTPLPPDVQFSLVRLAADRCPSWVSGSCTLSVATQSGLVMGVSFLTFGRQSDAIENSVSQKFGHAPTSRKHAKCQPDANGQAGLVTREGTDRSWELPHVSIRYTPVNGLTCEQGRVLVDTATMSKLVDRSPLPRREAEPKM